MEKRKTYRSKIDWWLLGILILAMAFSTLAASRDGNWFAIAINSGIILFIAHLYRKTYYFIAFETLHIRASILVRHEIPVEQISSISKTMNPLSAPALSLQRLAVKTINGGYYLISPRLKDRREFIDALLAINPHIKVADQLMEPRTF